MVFGFFKDKETGPLEVACPLCDNHQQESRLAVSSYCRKCGAYLTFDKDGKVSARPQNPPDPFANRPPQTEVVVDYRARKEKEATPAEEKRAKPEPQPEPPPESSAPKETATPKSSPDSASSRYQRTPPAGEKTTPQRKIETREVICFECGDRHEANVLANSTQCRKCGRLISMTDREIRETWTSPIQTRGDVHILKKGLVRAAPIQCHNLIVEGDFTNDADCTGDLIIRRHGKIPGKVRCHRLLVEKRAKVEFLGPVEIMKEGRIDGVVTGNLACHGLLALEKKAVLTGNLKVGRLTIADGATHNGQVRMGPF